MHPEVTSDKPGNCPKCGMKLQLKQDKEQPKQDQKPGGASVRSSINTD